jgi:[ribosomal protein S18]-alanine N-acetyltransferase
MITIRAARSSDAKTIARIGYRAWEKAIGAWEPDVDAMRDKARSAYDGFARDSWATIIVAERDGALTGWAARENRDHVISDLWIDPAHQRSGIGRALMVYLEAAMEEEGLRAAALETHARNNVAIVFYKSLGYQVKWLSTKYSAPLDRDIEKVGMEKPLAPDGQADTAEIS